MTITPIKKSFTVTPPPPTPSTITAPMNFLMAHLTTQLTFVQFQGVQCVANFFDNWGKCSVKLATALLNMTKEHATFLYTCSVLFSKMFSALDQTFMK